ncbi:hypothetical protein CLOP_g14492 [Closterium sp. NIES-67]|nr:hypothetical protein CLOP_g14492 [Closterium sp. NIES-67]
MGAGASQPASQHQRRSQPARPPQYYPPVPYTVPAGPVPQPPYAHAPYPYGYAYHPQPAGGVAPSPWSQNPQYPHPAPHPHAAPWYNGYPGHAPPPYQVPVPPMMAMAPPPVVAEPQQAVTIRNEVNVKRSSLRLQRDPSDPTKHLVAFTFDATVSGSLSVFIAAQEGEGCSFRELYPHLHTARVFRFSKGLGQKFVQAPGTGVDLACIPEEHLLGVSPTNPVYPLVIRTRVEPRGSKPPTVASPEIYGIEQCGRATTGRGRKGEQAAGEGGEGGKGGGGSALEGEEEDEDEVAGKECVICMSAPRDTTVLPCRHMCMCADCAKVLRYQTNKCPICRQPVQSLLEIRVPPRMPSLDGPEPTSLEQRYSQGQEDKHRQHLLVPCLLIVPIMGLEILTPAAEPVRWEVLHRRMVK